MGGLLGSIPYSIRHKAGVQDAKLSMGILEARKWKNGRDIPFDTADAAEVDSNPQPLRSEMTVLKAKHNN